MYHCYLLNFPLSTALLCAKIAFLRLWFDSGFVLVIKSHQKYFFEQDRLLKGAEKQGNTAWRRLWIE